MTGGKQHRPGRENTGYVIRRDWPSMGKIIFGESFLSLGGLTNTAATTEISGGRKALRVTDFFPQRSRMPWK
jgi:hypothetical protein